MEYEKKFWINSKVSSGFQNNRPKTFRSKAIHESEYEHLRELRDEGISVKELAKRFGCCVHSVIKTLKRIDSQQY